MVDQSAKVMVEQIRRAIVEDDFNLSEWEEGFFANIADIVERGQTLSPPREAKLVEIWKKATG